MRSLGWFGCFILGMIAACGSDTSSSGAGGAHAVADSGVGDSDASGGGGSDGHAGTAGATGGAAGATGGAAGATGGAAGVGGSSGSSGSTGAGGASTPHAYRCAPVGTAPTDGIFSLRAFNGLMYAGLFGYGHESESMVFRYPPWQQTAPGLLGVAESVCAMIEFQGMLYVNTESDGHIERSSDGVTWQRVFAGASGLIGCGLEVFDGMIYAVSYDFATHQHGRILRSQDGWTWTTVLDSGAEDLYLRHIVAHAGRIYALGTREAAGQGKILSSDDGSSWTVEDAPTRFFRGFDWKGDLYLSSTTKRSNGVTGIWKLVGGTPELVHPVDTTYVTELAAWDDGLWAATGSGWKEDVGTSSLMFSRDGQTWATTCTFAETTAWAVAPLGDHLYVGTWKFGQHGKLYEVSIRDPGAGGSGGGSGVDCSAIAAANPAWEVCESGPSSCAGVFTDGVGCDAYCAPAGLTCFARYGGGPGCVKEPGNVLACGDDNGHQSDWCECR